MKEVARKKILDVFTIDKVEKLFWGFVNNTETCWLWTGGRSTRGYGEISLGGYRDRAHRVSWTIHYGPIPEDGVICHRCDNPPCVRPDHLFLGTQADNVKDMTDKGRRVVVCGEKQHLAKLTVSDVLEIRRRSEEGEVSRVIAEPYGVDPATVRAVIGRKTWKHV